MKKSIILVTLATITLSASAQFSGNSAGSSSMGDNSGWNTVYAEWNPTSMYYTGKGDADKVNFNAFSLGYSKAFALSQSVPIFLEAGLAAQFMFKSETVDERYYEDDSWWKEKQSIHMLSVKVPVNVIYKWNIPNSRVELMPFMGISLRGNVWGEWKESLETVVNGKHNDENGSDSYNLFSKDEMEGKQWKRFQIGWQAGIKARFNEKFLIGGSIGTDFMEIAKKEKFINGSIMLGYTF
ncbi:MAG: outer membrane beta-barrel protein [Muribaculaceae bacterium]|nr:outer membrane beta-barrel protein [Muribaculaceae bacterium]